MRYLAYLASGLFLKSIKFVILLSSLLLLGSCNEKRSDKNSGDTEKELIKNSILADEASPVSTPGLIARKSKIDNALQSEKPVLLLPGTAASESQAQAIAINNPDFSKHFFDKATGKPFLNEIFNIYKARPQEIPQGINSDMIYRVEMYNFGLNLTTVALVDLAQSKVLNVSELVQTQPDIPLHLKELALEIATGSPIVATELGYQPDQSEAVMANTKTALNNTRCEQSLHLCVAPTFVQKDKALWAIVDLSELRLVGVRWTHVGDAGPTKRISEKNLRYDKIMECYCNQINPLKKRGWALNYVLTSSDGLRISEVNFKGKPVISNAKVVDWHVSYSNTDSFGYSDAVGCPEFSQAAVLATSEPRVSEILDNGRSIGFALEQTFNSKQWPQPCNYNYLQRYEFYDDGRFRVTGASLGRGCGNNGTYRPVTRIALYGSENTVHEWDGTNWNAWKNEQWKLQDSRTPYTKEGYQYKIMGAAGNGYYLEPGNGQFGDGGRGDNAYVYVTRLHADIDEGEKDLVSIGPCCNNDHRQGPEKFIGAQPENIEKQSLVLWYVAQLKNDDSNGSKYCWAESYLENGVYKTKTYPCISGPMFVPVSN